MTLRDHCDEVKRAAHAFLDLVRAGMPADALEVSEALVALGEVL